MSRKNQIYLAWICGNRALPFLCEGQRGFVYWGDMKQRILLSIFSVLDICASIAHHDISEMRERSDEIYDIINTIDSTSGYVYRYENGSTSVVLSAMAAISYAAKAACYAIEGAPNYLFYLLESINHLLSSPDGINLRFKEYLSAETTEVFNKIALSDLYSIIGHKSTPLHNDITVYGNLWHFFLNDLSEVGLSYWAKLYEELFANKFSINIDMLERRILIQKAYNFTSYYQAKNESPKRIENVMIYKNAETYKTLVEEEVDLRRTEVFISYKRDEDYDIFKELKVSLDVLKRSNDVIKYWYDGMIGTGQKWYDEIKLHLKNSKVAILLVSEAFLTSDFIFYEELPELLQAAENENATIIWIPVSTSQVERIKVKNVEKGIEVRIADYQAACDPKKPLRDMQPSERKKYICPYVKIY